MHQLQGKAERVAIALGSNLRDRQAHLRHAVSRLRSVLDDVRVSGYYETEPVGMADRTPLFLNAAATGIARVGARDLLRQLQAIEEERDRRRPHANASRTLDLDLVLFGNLVIDEPDLVVPHPRFRERRFVLEPLAEIAPEMRDPVTGLTVAELLRALPAPAVPSVRL